MHSGDRSRASTAGAPTATPADDWRGAVAYCLTAAHLRRTVPIAVAVGLMLAAINQLDVIV